MLMTMPNRLTVLAIETLMEASYSELVSKRRPVRAQEAAEQLDGAQ
jgi:hypothetical protein